MGNKKQEGEEKHERIEREARGVTSFRGHLSHTLSCFLSSNSFSSLRLALLFVSVPLSCLNLSCVSLPPSLPLAPSTSFPFPRSDVKWLLAAALMDRVAAY